MEAYSPNTNHVATILDALDRLAGVRPDELLRVTLSVPRDVDIPMLQQRLQSPLVRRGMGHVKLIFDRIEGDVRLSAVEYRRS